MTCHLDHFDHFDAEHLADAIAQRHGAMSAEHLVDIERARDDQQLREAVER